MKRYFSIYRCLLILNYRRAFAHRADFYNGLFASIIWGIFSVVLVFILTARSSSVFGWSRTDLFVLTGVFNLLIGGVCRTIFSRNFDRFSHVIQYGELDGLLLKPIDSQFALSLWYINYNGFVRILLAVLYTVILLSYVHHPLTFFNGLYFIFLSICGLLIIYAFWFLVMTCIMWFPDLYNLVELLYTTDNLTRYPPQVLWSIRIAFFVVFYPVTLVVSVPTKALLHTVTLTDTVILMTFAIFLLYLSKSFWHFALRYYTSASA